MIYRNSNGQFVKGLSTNEHSGRWKGDKVSYSSLHCWIRKNFGTPNECERCGFKHQSNRKIHWASRNKKYSRKRRDWTRLCVPCHKKLDMTPKMRRMYQEMMKKVNKKNHANT